MTNTILKGEELSSKKKFLLKIGTDETGWLVYFVDRDSNRWVEEYPNSEYHGGANPQLRLIEKFPWEENRNHKADFLIVQKIINEFDPCGLIEAGAPIDEYEFMTNKILSFVYNKKNFEEVTQNISKELVENFGLDISESNSEKLRHEIEEVMVKTLIEISRHYC
jgi:hypothetical protein